ncbi:unnamed protein product [Protopolystoma xenopodis]|uniref:KY-like immunoglobulin-like domain-containing protein n=1 Tax=Protopolystoma xenopodis TaxID=117903 RepID=A0A448WI64_9PLAT|nr:unnamed protein product [Protopolystoma xenopodis]
MWGWRLSLTTLAKRPAIYHWSAAGNDHDRGISTLISDYTGDVTGSLAVYSHFPEDASWQLLPQPLNLSQFENLPLTKSQFFKCAMDFLDQHHGVVHTLDGHLRMALGFWRPGCFTYKLQYLAPSYKHPRPEELRANPKASATDLIDKAPPGNPIDLKCYTLQETTRDRLNFFFRLPARGVYYLTIYAQVSNLFILFLL